MLTATHDANLLRYFFGFRYLRVIDAMKQTPDLISQVSRETWTRKQSAECFRSHTLRQADIPYTYLFLGITIDKASVKGGRASQHVVPDLLGNFEAYGI